MDAPTQRFEKQSKSFSPPRRGRGRDVPQEELRYWRVPAARYKRRHRRPNALFRATDRKEDAAY